MVTPGTRFTTSEASRSSVLPICCDEIPFTTCTAERTFLSIDSSVSVRRCATTCTLSSISDASSMSIFTIVGFPLSTTTFGIRCDVYETYETINVYLPGAAVKV